MYQEYEPRFYAAFNAADNCYYFSGNGCADGCEETEPGVFLLRSVGARISVERESCGKARAVRQRTVLENVGDEPLSVELLSSAYLTGIGRGGVRPWRKNRFVIHYADSCWTGEAQWKHVFAEDAGLYKTYNHNSQSSFRMLSKSTWSTCRYEPVVIITDTELGRSWFCQIDCGHGWCINAGIRGYRDDTELCVLATDCMEYNDGWHTELEPGGRIRTCNALTGCVEGGFEEAIAELTEARRSYMRTDFAAPPLCYNDYMNALWALPTREKTLPLIAAAADAGCEYYVMDAGWYSVHGNENEDLGMWEQNDALFGEGGLQGIFDEVTAHGMKPGIWFEIESAGASSRIVEEHPEYVLRRHGRPLGGRRVMLDFRQAGVREHIEKRIDALYGMGVRFIKNDYNANTGAGVDGDGAVSVHEHTEAFYAFIDEIRAKYPDLIVENCGSGAMRADMETLSHFHLQSVSDQEDCFRLPSIVSGTEACIPPERCGIWAYPYPVKIDFRQSFSPSEEFTKRFADGKVTSYCMVTGLMGLMYLSGRIDCADGFNRNLIREAAKLYKEYRPNICRAVPVYPSGTFYIDTDRTDCFGLLDRESGIMTVAVWNNSSSESVTKTDLKKYVGQSARIKTVYPAINGYTASLDGGILSTRLPSGPSALYAVIES
ncbi:MAG: alpha-galactosidase [Clostridia bacterium]|nr:alpha-galactosidase [Clostridia bacterium]